MGKILMKAKFIHESLGDLLAGKSDEQIRKDLNFQRQSRSVERFSRVLNNKLTDSIGNFYEVVLVLEHDWWLWFYKYDKYSKKWVVDQSLTLDQVRSIIEMRAKLKKFNTFPNSRNNDLLGMNALMMEVGKTIQNYHKLKTKTNESIGDLLLPKNKEDVYAEFEKHGITGETISIRIRRPEADYNWLRLNRCLLKTDTEMSEYHGPVPEEEHEEYFLKISGKPWNILRFNQIYFGYGPLPIYLEIETLKQNVITESISNILKPKDENEIVNYFKNRIGTEEEKVTIKFRNPIRDKSKARLKRWIDTKKINVNIIDDIYSELSGNILDVVQFLQDYYSYTLENAIFNIRYNIVRESLNEGLLLNIKNKIFK